MDQAAFVGRDRELAGLDRLLVAAGKGDGGVVLVDGEPGIGKTAVAIEVARRAREQGCATAWGGCLEGAGAPAYWPWIQVLRDLGDPAEQLIAPTGDDAGSRFRMFDQAIEALRRSASKAGLLIVLDDLHWADLPSLRLLQVLAAEVAELRLLVVGLYRGIEVGEGSELAGVVHGIGRERGATGLTLAGLADDEVAELAGGVGDHHPDDPMVRAVQERAEGNPFFVLELIRLAEQSGTVRGALPSGIREAIGRRLTGLAEDTRRTLREASVIGREFTVGQLAAMAGRPATVVLDLLDQAHARDLVVSGEGPELRFSHALTREVAYAELAAADRLRLHQRVAEVIGEDDAVIDARAHHLRQAVPLGSADDAVAVTLRAAERARRQLAYEHAAYQYRQALELLPLVTEPAVTRQELLLDLARCQFRAGAVADAWQSCRQAADLGRADGQPTVVADAATVIRGVTNAPGDPLCGKINALARQALTMLGEDDPVREAKLLAQLAITSDAFTSDGTAQLSQRALQLAEATGDVDARFLAMQARQIELIGPRHVLERLAIGERAVALGQETGRDEFSAWGHLWRLDAFWELGRRRQLDRELAEYATVVSELKEPLELWRLTIIKACVAEIEGRFDDAWSLADQALRIGQRGGHQGANFVHLIFRSRMARLTGIGAEEAEESVRRFSEQRGPHGARGWHGVQLAAMGRLGEAAEALNAVAAGLPSFPPNAPEWLPARYGMAGLAARTGNREVAAMIYPDLLPFADRQVAAGAATGSEGPVALALGMLALLLDDHEAAADHLKAALEGTQAMHSPPYEALTRLELARLMLARRGTGDARTAKEQLDLVLSAARRLGMKPLESEASELLAQHRSTPLSPREHELAGLIADGLSNRQIAARLYLSERTVETHVRNILNKLGFERRSQVASWKTTRSRR